jgi:hypothetical protein
LRTDLEPMRATLLLFAVLLALLLVVFSTGWYAATFGPDNPIPWAIVSVWGDMLAVGMAVEQVMAYVPNDGRSLTHAVLVIGSSATIWALLFSLIFVGIVWCVRIVRKLVPSRP